MLTESKIKYARYAGILYLLIAVISPVAIMYIPAQLISDNSITDTIQNIMNNEFLFRLGTGIETTICILEIMVSIILYKIFKEVHPTLSVIALASRLCMAVIQAINALASLTITEVLTSSLINDSGTASIIFALLKYVESGIVIWQIFFGLHLIVLGYVVYKSNYVGKIFGVLMSVSSLGYLADSYFKVFSLDSGIFPIIVSVLLVISTLGEITFMLRLLIKKINVRTSNG